MSGFKTTSIFGSLINLAICWSVLSKLDIKPIFLAVLGDDIDIGFDQSIRPSDIYSVYELIHFPIAVDKTKFTKGANCGTDFLWVQHRRVGGKLLWLGYAARAINALCYSKPW